MILFVKSKYTHLIDYITLNKISYSKSNNNENINQMDNNKFDTVNNLIKDSYPNNQILIKVIYNLTIENVKIFFKKINF